MKTSERSLRHRNSVLSVLEIFRKSYPSITGLQMVLFFYVAENPRSSVIDISALANVSLSTGSRALRSLLSPRDGLSLKPCLDLVRLDVNPSDGRSKLAFLTDKGLILAQSINTKIEHAILIDLSLYD